MRIYGIAIGQWFLNSYVIVMFLVPMVNLAIDRMTVKELLSLVLVSFGWSFATTLPVSRYVPAAQGLTAYSFLTLLGVYVVARFARKTYEAGGRFCRVMGNRRIVLPAVAASLSMAAIGLGDYNSPFAVAIAGGVFFMLKGCGIPRWLGCTCKWLGPSMFSVYLLHSHGQAWGHLRNVEEWFLSSGVPLWLAWFVTAAVVFAACVMADMPRRIASAVLRRVA